MDIVDINSLFIELEPKCDFCGKQDRLLHQVVDLQGTVQGIHCDNCCHIYVTQWMNNNMET